MLHALSVLILLPALHLICLLLSWLVVINDNVGFNWLLLVSVNTAVNVFVGSDSCCWNVAISRIWGDPSKSSRFGTLHLRVVPLIIQLYWASSCKQSSAHWRSTAESTIIKLCI